MDRTPGPDHVAAEGRANLRAVPDPVGLSTLPGAASAWVTSETDAERVIALQHELDGLREAMRSRAVIEQAKGIVMTCHGIPQDQAFTVLVRWSSVWNIKLRDVAATLVCLGFPHLSLVGDERRLEQVMAQALDRVDAPVDEVDPPAVPR